MKFKFRGLKVSLPEGVDAARFDANRVIATIPEEVIKLFQSYEIDLKEECPGTFLKGFTLNEKELAEVSSNLKRLNDLELINIIKSNPKNLQIRVFKNTFMKRFVELIHKGVPYLNADNSFADYLLNNEMDKIPSELTQTDVIKAQIEYESKQESPASEDQLVQMSPEDKQVYNEIVEKLNYLVLANPLDTGLATVVRNATNKAVDAILRKEYKFLGIREMVESVMFDGLDVTTEDNERITNLVLGAFPDEERKMM